MLRHLPTVPPVSEPEGWDAAHVLQLVNPIKGQWSCPTFTKRARRCENVVSQTRRIKVTFLLNSMSLEDPSVVARDYNRELTDLAEAMLCPVHSRDADSKEKVQGVVAQWRVYIKTSMRQQSQQRPPHTIAKAPIIDYQPFRDRNFDALPESRSTAPQKQPRIKREPVDMSPAPQAAPPSYGATIDQAAVGEIMTAFQDLTLQNHQLRDQNKKLREQNAQLAEQRDAAAREYKRTRGELEAAEKERDALDTQVDEQFNEINSLRDREAEQLEKISTLQDTLQKTGSAYRRAKKIWTADSVQLVPNLKGKV